MIRLGYWAVGLLLHGVVVAASAENAVNPADARRVVAHRLQLPAPKNAFEAWVADMTLWAALGCARGASLDEELRLLEKVRLHKKTGAYRSPKEGEAAMCAALAKQPTPTCWRMSSTAEPFRIPPAHGMRDYLYLAKEQSWLNKPSFPLLATAECNLTEQGLSQTYVGPALFTWTQLPRQTTLNGPRGPYSAVMGNGLLQLEGLRPEPKIVVIAAP